MKPREHLKNQNIKDTCVYVHFRNDTNQVFYVGIGNIKRPKDTGRRSEFWYKIVKKVGYTTQVLVENLSWYDACEIEVYLIEKFGRRDLNKGNLVNMTNGGDGAKGIIMSKEAIEKAAQWKRGKKRPDHVKEKLRLANLGKKHPASNYIKRIETIKKNNNGGWYKKSKEGIERIANSKRGIPRSPEVREKLRLANLGKKASLEQLHNRKKTVLLKTLTRYGIFPDDPDDYMERLINTNNSGCREVEKLSRIFGVKIEVINKNEDY